MQTAVAACSPRFARYSPLTGLLAAGGVRYLVWQPGSSRLRWLLARLLAAGRGASRGYSPLRGYLPPLAAAATDCHLAGHLR
ncbi:MAG TPA: hypothetical protein VMZ90_10925, partial [Vicinamibacterales bacterium]|nr:hypothetical protein [Vicinamibacterales bacterium]